MNQGHMRHWRLLALLTVVLASLALRAPAHAKGGADPQAFPPQEAPYGQDTGAWAAGWWRWVVETPPAANPIQVSVPCAPAQSGPVWYLAGSFSGKPRNDTCTIPAGTSLFVPLINTAYFQFPTDSEAALEEGIEGVNSFVASIDPATLKLKIDGLAVENLAAYRVDGPLFTYGPLPADNLLEQPEGTSERAYNGGYYVMLQPLTPGRHTLHFKARAGDFAQNVTYTIIVEGR